MKPRLPLWEPTQPSSPGPTFGDTYPDQPLCPEVPLVCIGSTQGPTVMEPSAQIFFEALSAINGRALLKLTCLNESTSPPQCQTVGNIIALTASVKQLPEALALCMREKPHLKLVVVNASVWHHFYQTKLSVLIGPLQRDVWVSAPPRLRRVSLWMPETRPAALTAIAQNLSSFVPQAC